MAIIWCGGEDIDFNLQPNQYTLSTSSSYHRPNFSRYAISTNNSSDGAFFQSTQFSIPLTSCWLTSVISFNGSAEYNTTSILVGLSNALYKNEFLGIGMFPAPNGSSNFLQLVKVYNNLSIAALAASSYFLTGNTPIKVDMQLINYGPNASVILYANGSQILDCNANIQLPNTQQFDCVGISSPVFNAAKGYVSEIIVSTTSTLPIQGLVTVPPSGNGNIQDWLNPNWSNLANVQINDANSIYVNTPDQDTQYMLSNAWPIGDFAIDTVAIKIRDEATLNSNIGNIQVGFANVGGNLSLGNVELAPVGFTYPNEWYFNTDPTSLNGAAPWGNANISSYQLDIRSVS